jgi:methylated-DNA-protein-cysteine methyltransferase-like protein
VHIYRISGVSSVATAFSLRVRNVIAAIPEGRVASYGQIAALAGNNRAARQVAWILHSSSKAYNLPWHRVIGVNGCISLPRGRGYEEQRMLLEREGICFDGRDRIDMNRYRWSPEPIDDAGGTCY